MDHPFVEIIRSPSDEETQKGLILLQEQFPQLRPETIISTYQRNQKDLNSTINELQYRKTTWIIESKAISEISNSLNLLAVRRLLPDASMEEVHSATPGTVSVYQIVEKIMMARKTKTQVFMKNHPNKRYCPDLFTLPQNHGELIRVWYRVGDQFPGHDPSTFFEESTFFLAAAAPEDWEDLYGEPFSNRERVYAFVRPKRYESIKFYSSEELVSSFIQASDFIDPKSLTNDRFNERQIDRLLELTDSVLESVIYEIRLNRKEAIQEMKRMSSLAGFKDCLKLTLKIGMLMRGWSGEGEYPLFEKETLSPVDDVKLTEALLNLKGRLETDWAPFKELRLIKGREPNWQLSDQSLWERLIIVLDGEQGDSCIRMTSSLYAMTAWFCLDRFFNERYFNLNKLDDIF